MLHKKSFLPKNTIKYWSYQDTWLCLVKKDSSLYWQVNDKIIALPPNTYPYSKFNDTGGESVCPNSNCWVWIDKDTQALWYTDFNTSYALTGAKLASGSLCWVNENSIAWIEENNDNKLRSIYMICVASQQITNLIVTEKLITEIFMLQNQIQCLSETKLSTRLIFSNCHLIKNSKLFCLNIRKSIWSQPIVYKDNLYMINTFLDHRSIFNITKNYERMTSEEEYIGATKVHFKKKDYIIWQDQLYYACFDSTWSWKRLCLRTKKIVTLLTPWDTHIDWHYDKEGPWISGSFLGKKGVYDVINMRIAKNI